MIAKSLPGFLGSIFDLGFPGLALLAAQPPLGWQATGGRGVVLSLFKLDAGRPGRDRIEALNLVDFPCPGALPDRSSGTYRDELLIVCVRVAADGRVVAIELFDIDGEARKAAGLAALIRSNCRFRALHEPDGRPVWHRIRLGSGAVAALRAGGESQARSIERACGI